MPILTMPRTKNFRTFVVQLWPRLAPLLAGPTAGPLQAPLLHEGSAEVFSFWYQRVGLPMLMWIEGSNVAVGWAKRELWACLSVTFSLSWASPLQLKNGSSVLPGSTRVRPGEIRNFLTLVPVRFITKSGCPLTQLKYRSCTFLDKFRYTRPKNKYEFTVSAKCEFRPSAPSACNKYRKFRRGYLALWSTWQLVNQFHTQGRL